LVAAYNPLSPEVRENPYPAYHALRLIDPVLWIEMMQAWVLTSYEDIQTVLKDNARFSSDRTRAGNEIMRQMQEQ